MTLPRSLAVFDSVRPPALLLLLVNRPSALVAPTLPEKVCSPVPVVTATGAAVVCIAPF